MSVRSHRVAAVSTGAAILVALSSVGAVASGLVTSADIKDGAVKTARPLSPAPPVLRARRATPAPRARRATRRPTSTARSLPRGRRRASSRSPRSAAATPRTRRTCSPFQLPEAGTYLVNAYGFFDRLDATADGYEAPSTVAAPTTITVRAFGYNEDRSGFGGAPNSATPQFSVFANASAVRVG